LMISAVKNVLDHHITTGAALSYCKFEFRSSSYKTGLVLLLLVLILSIL
jgi:hypothetical protein